MLLAHKKWFTPPFKKAFPKPYTHTISPGITLTETHILKLIQVDTYFIFFFWLCSSHRNPPTGKWTKWSCSGGKVYLLNGRKWFWGPPFFIWGWHLLPKSHKATVCHSDTKHSSFLWMCLGIWYNVVFLTLLDGNVCHKYMSITSWTHNS